MINVSSPGNITAYHIDAASVATKPIKGELLIMLNPTRSAQEYQMTGSRQY
jgi:hypothetical protein